jgi:hypothetical protein
MRGMGVGDVMSLSRCVQISVVEGWIVLDSLVYSTLKRYKLFRRQHY